MSDLPLLETYSPKSFLYPLIRRLDSHPLQRCVTTTIDPASTAIVCRKETLSEAIAYYKERYTVLPQFYTDGPQCSSPVECDVAVHAIATLPAAARVHIFASFAATRAGHSGISYLVRLLARQGIFTPSIERGSIAKFLSTSTGVSFSEEELYGMERCYNGLFDEQSRTAFLGACKARMTGDTGYIPFAPYPQYFHPKVPVCEGDVLCEGGVCDGKTSVKFSQKVGMSGKVICFEPVPSCCSVAQKRIQQHANIQLCNKALWHCSATLPLVIDSPSSGFSSLISSKNANAECLATSIDEYFGRITPPSVIKLDVEGAELAVLEGAVNTLQKYRPKLIISIYHTHCGNDLLRIPEYILNQKLGYRLYVGHHSIWDNETILYAATNS